jgi:TolA-binding protein
MIARFMSSEKPLPQQTQGAQREADVYDLLAWFETNKKKVLVVALVLVAAGFAIATMRYMREQKEANASAQLLALKATLNPATNAVPPQPSAFLKVAQEFKGTSAAERARLLAGTAYFTEGKYSEAEAEFSAFMKEFPDSPWIATAAYGIASAQEAQNKPEAVASYQNVATAYANSVVADDAKLALARIHEAKNQPDQALRLYNELLTAKPGDQAGGPAHSEAFARKEALLKAHPELGTNQVGAVPSAPSDVIRIPSSTNAPAATGATNAPTP